MSFPRCPGPPSWKIDWEVLEREGPWLRSLAGCPQDPGWHGEGDVLAHTKMVAEALAGMEAWRALGAEEREVLFAAALLHDAGKPLTTRPDLDGKPTSRGHARRGAIVARKILWRAGVPFAARERTAALVRHHGAPLRWPEAADPRRVAIAASQTARCDHLVLLAEADVRGRATADRDRLFETAALFGDLCREQGCLSAPRRFASDHARFLYFRDERRAPDAPAHEERAGEAVLLSGLPGAGKNRWIRERLPGWPVVSLDDLREILDVSPEEGQGAVVDRARALAREHLRAHRPFAWNATSLSRQVRDACIGLFARYGARVRIVYVEVPEERLRRQNRERPRPVPGKVLEALLDRWEVPDITEAHEVTAVIGD